MFIRVKSSSNSPRQSVQIVQSLREGSRVKQVVLRHVGVADNPQELKQLKELAGVVMRQIKQQETPGLFLEAPEDFASAADSMQGQTMVVDLLKLQERQRSILGFHQVYGKLYQELGFDTVIARPSSNGSAIHLLKQMVMARLACPGSKRQSVRDLNERFGIQLSLSAVYRMMDHVDDKAVHRIEQCAFDAAVGLLGGKINVVFYDCTTLYFESFQEDEAPAEDDATFVSLRSKGCSKENRFNQTQVLLALAVTTQGLPLGYQLFPGKTFEGHTFKTFLEQVQSRWHPTELIVVADSAMLSQENIALLEEKKYGYIVGARLKSVDRQTALKVQQHGTEAEIRELPLSSTNKLVVSYCPVRARKDAHEREKAIERVKKKLARSKSPKGLMNARGTGRYLKLQGQCEVQLNEQAIADASVWDGLHGVTTNLLAMDGKAVREQYHGLWQVEDCFRISKHDLHFRPIFHWTPTRIRAHVAICFMALCCARTLMYRVKLQQGEMSAGEIQRALLSVQASVYEHVESKQRYEMPGRPLAAAGKLYKTMGLKLRTSARQLGVCV